MRVSSSIIAVYVLPIAYSGQREEEGVVGPMYKEHLTALLNATLPTFLVPRVM